MSNEQRVSLKHSLHCVRHFILHNKCIRTLFEVSPIVAIDTKSCQIPPHLHKVVCVTMWRIPEGVNTIQHDTGAPESGVKSVSRRNILSGPFFSLIYGSISDVLFKNGQVYSLLVLFQLPMKSQLTKLLKHVVGYL